MLSLLVVDDERIIAEGLYQMLQETFQDQLVVRRCYSFHEAQSILETCRVDILMTDIEMPDVSGLELHEWVRNRWPMVRVIYLTGYSDFDYARRALEQNALAYVLKSEGDPVIVEAVQRAIASIREENAKLLRLVKEERGQSGRIHQLVYHAMHGGSVSKAQFRQALEEQDWKLDVDTPVLLGYCYSEEPGFHTSEAMGLVERLVGERLPILLTEMTSRAFLLICQAEREDDRHVLRGLIENVQLILEKQNDWMTVCLLEEPFLWEELAQAGEVLLEEVNRISPVKGELLVLANKPSSAGATFPGFAEEWSETLDSLRRLNEYLLTGQRDLYFEEEKHLWQSADGKAGSRQARTVNGALAMSLLHCAANLPDDSLPAETMENLRGYRGGRQYSPEELHGMAEMLFDIRGQNKSNRQMQLINRVNEYVSEHMDGDLSLVAIADAVHFHPVYLSRIYKENAGVSLSDYIANQRLNTACMLLRTSQTQISAIAKSTGFTSSNYFSRWFRKRIGLTPQEYRDKAVTSK